MAEKKKNTWLIIGAVFMALYIYGSNVDKSQPTAGPQTESHRQKKHRSINPTLQALFTCQNAIKSISRDYNSAEVPYSKDYGDDNEFYFAWNNRNPIKMVNGFGQKVPTSGSCIVSATTGKITSLTLGGKDIIHR